MAHKEQLELAQEIDLAIEKVAKGDRFSHYKNPEQTYSILAIGVMEATEEVSVVYQAEYGEGIVWIRTLKDFLARVPSDNGAEVDRFTKVG